MLYQHMLHTQEVFRAAQLQVPPKAPQYFGPNGKRSSSFCIRVDAHLLISSGQLKKNPDVLNWPIKARLDELRVVSDEEVTATVKLIERYLHLGPSGAPERPMVWCLDGWSRDGPSSIRCFPRSYTSSSRARQHKTPTQLRCCPSRRNGHSSEKCEDGKKQPRCRPLQGCSPYSRESESAYLGTQKWHGKIWKVSNPRPTWRCVSHLEKSSFAKGYH